MESKQTVAAGAPPTIPPSLKTVYAKMGESNIFHFMREVYIEMKWSAIGHFFVHDVDLTSQKSAAYFVEILGGPPLYQQRYGSHDLHRRHQRIQIDEAARREWVRCFEVVLNRSGARYNFPQEHLPDFYLFLDRFSRWLINSD